MEVYEVKYYSLDFNGKFYVERTKRIYFKDEALGFAKRMEQKSGKISRIYKIIEKRERIY